VAACVRQVYGDSYVHRELYRPDEVVRLNEAGRLVSVVARDAAGRVVGHYALERPDGGPIAEEGEALVLPECRHHHLMESMRDLLEAEARLLELAGLFGQAVTNHVFTQKVHERYGLVPCAVSLGATPRSFHNMPEPLPQRMSLLVAFKFLDAPVSPPAEPAAGRPPAGVYCPPRHRVLCARIYERLGVPPEFRDGTPPRGPGRVTVEFEPELQAGLIRVCRGGSDTAAQIARARRELSGSGAEAVFLDLPLAQAETPALCRAAEEDGFFFSGIGPRFAADGDALRLQWLGVPLDLSLLQIDSPWARELVAYVGRERRGLSPA
jgi:serine/threonine-protein kinase RsbW